MRAVVLLSLLVLSASAAHADEFGGWKFSVPAGFKKKETGDHVELMKLTGKTFCQVTLFAARAPAGDDQAYEWKNVVEKNFTVKTSAKPQTRKTKHLTYIATSGTVTSGTNTWAMTHYFLQPQGVVSSVMLMASDEKTLARCPITAFLDSLESASTPAPQATPPATTNAIVVGRWGTSSTAYQNGMSLGYQARQYTFNADGTYVWHFEAWGGHSRSKYYHLIHETGSWTLDGARLSIDPKTSMQTVIDKDRQVTKRPLEKATYTVQKVYMDGLQKFYLVMAIAKPTARDGAHSQNEAHPRSYLFEENPLIEWKYPADR